MSAAPKPLPSSKENSATGHSRPLNSHSRTVNGATTAGQVCLFTCHFLLKFFSIFLNYFLFSYIFTLFIHCKTNITR